MYCVSTHVCACRCVFTSLCACVCVCQDEVTWLLSWAVREDPALCCQSTTNEKHKKQTTMQHGWQPHPLTVCVFCVCPTPPTHTLSGTPDSAKADLEMKNDPPLAVHCSISTQPQSGWAKFCPEVPRPYSCKDAEFLLDPHPYVRSPGTPSTICVRTNFLPYLENCTTRFSFFFCFFFLTSCRSWQSVLAMKHVSFKVLSTYLDDLSFIEYFCYYMFEWMWITQELNKFHHGHYNLLNKPVQRYHPAAQNILCHLLVPMKGARPHHSTLQAWTHKTPSQHRNGFRPPGASAQQPCGEQCVCMWGLITLLGPSHLCCSALLLPMPSLFCPEEGEEIRWISSST